MTRLDRLLVIGAFLVAPGAGARAQQVAYAANVATELDSATQAALTREINAARERGLPTEPLIGKVREGRLKLASPVRIRGAVSSLIRRLDSARAGLGAQATADEMAAGADALAAGADVAALRAVRAASARPVAVPVGTLAQLLLSGIEQKRAVEMVVTLLRRNATPSQIIALGNLIESDVASGLRPEEAALFRLRGIEGSIGFSQADAVTAAPGGSPVTSQTGKPHRSP